MKIRMSKRCCKFYLRSISLMNGNEIFISKSMKCFKIFDLAQALIKYFQKLNKK